MVAARLRFELVVKNICNLIKQMQLEIYTIVSYYQLNGTQVVYSCIHCLS